jgi:hypothetical protein
LWWWRGTWWEIITIDITRCTIKDGMIMNTWAKRRLVLRLRFLSQRRLVLGLRSLSWSRLRLTLSQGQPRATTLIGTEGWVSYIHMPFTAPRCLTSLLTLQNWAHKQRLSMGAWLLCIDEVYNLNLINFHYY